MLDSTATIDWLTAAHWKGHATSSPSFSKRSQIGHSYVPAGIERKTTTFTNKVRSDSFKLFKNNYSTSRNKTDYFLRYLVIYMPPKPFLLLGDLLKVSFGRRSAFGGKQE